MGFSWLVLSSLSLTSVSFCPCSTLVNLLRSTLLQRWRWRVGRRLAGQRSSPAPARKDPDPRDLWEVGWRLHCPERPDRQSSPDKKNISNLTAGESFRNNYQVLEGLWRFQSVDEGLPSASPGAGRVLTAQTNEIISIESDRLSSRQSGLVHVGSLARIVIKETPADRLPVLLIATPETRWLV